MIAPPTPDGLLAMMREAITEDPEQNALILVGNGDTQVALPCIALTPHEVLAALPAVIDGSIDWVAIVTDTYQLATREKPDLRPGQLGEMFAAGDPRVKEAILVCCLAPDGPSYAKQQIYTRADDKIIWEEPRDYPLQDMGGAITNGMRRALGLPVSSLR